MKSDPDGFHIKIDIGDGDEKRFKDEAVHRRITGTERMCPVGVLPADIGSPGSDVIMARRAQSGKPAGRGILCKIHAGSKGISVVQRVRFVEDLSPLIDNDNFCAY